MTVGHVWRSSGSFLPFPLATNQETVVMGTRAWGTRRPWQAENEASSNKVYRKPSGAVRWKTDSNHSEYCCKLRWIMIDWIMGNDFRLVGGFLVSGVINGEDNIPAPLTDVRARPPEEKGRSWQKRHSTELQLGLRAVPRFVVVWLMVGCLTSLQRASVSQCVLDLLRQVYRLPH